MLISLCSITRNEAANLPEWFALFDPLVDEYCIVDTGSADNTEAICRANPKVRFECSSFYGVDTPRRKFRFDKPKNEALGMAQGKWIMTLDPDFRISPERIPDIRACIERAPEHIDAVYFETWSADERVCHSIFLCNGRGYQYVGALHERLNKQPESDRVLKVTDTHFDHIRTAEAEGTEAYRAKHNVYREILVEELSGSPDDPRIKSLIASESLNVGDPLTARQYCEDVLLSAKDVSPYYRAAVAILYVRALVGCGVRRGLTGPLVVASLGAPDNAEIKWMIGEIKRAEGDLDAAEYWFRQALECPVPKGIFVRDAPSYRNERPLYGLNLIQQARAKVA